MNTLTPERLAQIEKRVEAATPEDVLTLLAEVKRMHDVACQWLPAIDQLRAERDEADRIAATLRANRNQLLEKLRQVEAERDQLRTGNEELQRINMRHAEREQHTEGRIRQLLARLDEEGADLNKFTVAEFTDRLMAAIRTPQVQDDRDDQDNGGVA